MSCSNKKVHQSMGTSTPDIKCQDPSIAKVCSQKSRGSVFNPFTLHFAQKREALQCYIIFFFKYFIKFLPLWQLGIVHVPSLIALRPRDNSDKRDPRSTSIHRYESTSSPAQYIKECHII